jgi:pimeloyl-ACP methyl ester carboxylesterase
MRGQVEVDHGVVSFAELGTGTPVVLLHQTPRSVDEYRDVLPALAGRGYRAIAFDTPGFGASTPLPEEPSIERWASALATSLDALRLERIALVGHHTGGVIALELAAQRPDRVIALVLSSTPLTDAAYRATPSGEGSVDTGEDAETLRASRAGFYPAGHSDLLDRYAADALRAGPLARLGHRAVRSYEMDDKIERIRMPVLLIGADQDPFAFPQLERMVDALPHAETAVIAGGMVPLPDGWPEQFAAAVGNFLDQHLR